MTKYPKRGVVLLTKPILPAQLRTYKNLATKGRTPLSAVNKEVDNGALLTARVTVVDRRRYTLNHHVCANNRQLSVCVLNIPGSESGRGQVLSTVDDDRHPLITLSIQLCVQRDGRLGVMASRGPSALADTCNYVKCRKGR